MIRIHECFADLHINASENNNITQESDIYSGWDFDILQRMMKISMKVIRNKIIKN